MLSTPQTITIATVANNLHKITSDQTSSLYQSEDGTHKFRVSHQETRKRVRRMARLDKFVIAADPLTAINSQQSVGVYIVIDEPLFGFSNQDVIDIVDGLKLWLTSANITAMLSSRH